MRLSKKIVSLIGASGTALLLCASAASAQSLVVTPGSVTGPAAGGSTTPGSIALVFTNGGTNPAGFQADLAFDDSVLTLTPTAVTPAGHFVTCVVVAPGLIRVAATNTVGAPDPAANGTYCTITVSVAAGSAEAPYPLTLQDEVDLASTTDGVVNVVGIPGPEVVVNPNGGAQTLTGSSGIGATNTFNFTASSTASPGGAGGANATIDCSLPAGSAFTIAPAGPQTFTSGTGSTVNYQSTCATVDGVVQNDTLTCSVTDQNGNRDVVFPLTCQAGVPIPGPTLALFPNGGALTLPPGIIGTPSSDSISVEVTVPGSAGGPSSTATCNTAAPFTVTGSPVTVPAGSSTGTFGSIGVTCTLTDAERTGTVTCDIDGGAPIVFDVTCPAGSVAPPPPTFVPASSLWSKLALFGIFAALGMLVLGLRRNH